MKLIIAGSRTFNHFNTDFLRSYLKTLGIYSSITQIVCGCGGTDQSKIMERRDNGLWASDQGIDLLGEKFAKEEGLPIAFAAPNWNKNGKRAGYLRNVSMGEQADALLLIWDGKSRGSNLMRTAMLDLHKPVYELTIRAYSHNTPELNDL